MDNTFISVPWTAWSALLHSIECWQTSGKFHCFNLCLVNMAGMDSSWNSFKRSVFTFSFTPCLYSEQKSHLLPLFSHPGSVLCVSTGHRAEVRLGGLVETSKDSCKLKYIQVKYAIFWLRAAPLARISQYQSVSLITTLVQTEIYFILAVFGT